MRDQNDPPLHYFFIQLCIIHIYFVFIYLLQASVSHHSEDGVTNSSYMYARSFSLLKGYCDDSPGNNDKWCINIPIFMTNNVWHY
jgi:hypothetical protein